MILRDRPSGIKLFLALRGSIVPRILPALLLNVAIATLVTWSHGDLFRLKITLTTIPFTLIGLPLAIFLGFRNNAAYDRFWEGRKLWGELVLRSRSLARQCTSLIAYPLAARFDAGLADLRVRMVLRTIAYNFAVRDLLRRQGATPASQQLLGAAEWHALQNAPNQPDFLLQQMAADLAQCLRERRIDPILAGAVDATLTALAGAAAGCERIRNTPVPFSYLLLLHRTSYLYCFLLPFGLVDSIGFMTPFVVGIVAYTFFGLDALGDELEEPFGLEANDLPLDAICRAIEIDLRAALGDPALPAPLVPVNYRLT